MVKLAVGAPPAMVQGEGAKNYVANGKMAGGFAVLATPIKYGDTRIMTFVLSREGVLYEQVLGPKTVEGSMTGRRDAHQSNRSCGQPEILRHTPPREGGGF
jgi:Protein of unknown function (DUF2950)